MLQQRTDRHNLIQQTDVLETQTQEKHELPASFPLIEVCNPVWHQCHEHQHFNFK